ncbi:MAG TPA: GTP cyclohydrolase I FolE, partial [Myxococcota bacterium]|nr:GTP cyclohydrolase I FolE [Myxococcota bacterium]
MARDLSHNEAKIAEAIAKILEALNEDSSRSGLRDTPKRVAKSLIDLTSGQYLTLKDVTGGAIFPSDTEGMVLQRGIEFYSLCEHHLLPFFGHVHLAYLPDNRIVGLSKLGRIVDLFSRRLQVQENLTHQILTAIDDLLSPKGAAVAVEAEHLCMMMRGIKKQGAVTRTCEF